MRIELYRPSGNNGVQILMTEDAWKAHLEWINFRKEHGDSVENSTVRGLRLRIGYGTFTFTSAEALLLPGGADRHYGTYQTIDYLNRICKVYSVSSTVGVPFSNGPDGYPFDFENGYGVKPGLFAEFMAQARKAYAETSDIDNLIEDAVR